MENLFLTILSISLTTSVVIVVLILLGSLINKRYVAKWKYVLWIALALRLLSPINYTIPDSDFQIMLPDEVGSMTVSDIIEIKDKVVTAQPADSGMMEPQSAEPQIMMPLPEEPDIHETLKPSLSLMQALAYLWAVGALCLVTWQLTGYFYCKCRILKRGKSAENVMLLEQLCELCRELGIRKDVNLLIYEKASSPMIIGFRHPILVLPGDEYTLQESYYILKHELIHLKRHDVLVKFLLMLARDIHWFNPIVYLMQKEAVVDMELACDEAVVSGTSSRQREAYSETLMSMLHGAGRRGPMLSTQFSGSVRIMKMRFRNILTRANKKNGGILFSFILIMTIMLGTMVGCSMEKPVIELSKKEASGQNTVEGVLLNLSVGANEMLGLSAREEDILRLSAEKINDSSDMAAVTGDIRERNDTAVLTVMREGVPEEISATLYKGEGYSFYLTDDEWDNFLPDEWIIGPNGQAYASFSIRSYAGLSKNRYEEIMTAKGYVKENGVLWWQLYDNIYGSILYETENDVWEFSFTYMMGKAEEGWASVMRAMADTFVVEAGYDVGEHTEKAVIPEGEHLQLYEDTYADLRIRHWWAGDLEKSKDYYVYNELTISNITDTSFEFAVIWRNPETEETGIIIPPGTAYFNEDMISATYTGEDYTLTFDFSSMYNPLPVVLYIRIWGMEELKGFLFYDYNAPGYEPRI